ncbi:DNA recombination protein RmuC [bacterium]|nr:DNA recombination protein RmuC [bacterium]
MIYYIVSFLAGAIISGIIVRLVSNSELIRVKTQLETFGNLSEVMKDDFSKLANEVIKKEQEDLRKQNQEALEQKIQPLTKELSEFKTKVDNFNISGEKNAAALKEQIKMLADKNQTIENETQKLVNALTMKQNAKGVYGENLLDTILQSCGMQENVHYNKQYKTYSVNSADNEVHEIKPDVVINLPDNRHLIIDSKVTLTSYLEYLEDETKLSKFKSEVKKRIDDLGKKNYQNAEGLYQPDFILMYVPIENAVNLLYEDAAFIYEAYKDNIIIVSTASLLTAIRLVNYLMSQQKQRESVNKIVDAGTSLYETFSQFCQELIEIQGQFDKTSGAFKTLINRFRRSNPNNPSLFSQVEALKEYGINTTSEIPKELLTSNAE